jgi:hypothetical protein
LRSRPCSLCHLPVGKRRRLALLERARVYSVFEAWFDLRQLAAWGAHERIVRGERIRLEPGELLLTVRQAAPLKPVTPELFSPLRLLQAAEILR